jgi:hypothetical protein
VYFAQRILTNTDKLEPAERPQRKVTDSRIFPDAVKDSRSPDFRIILSNKIKFLRRWGPVKSLYALLLRICRKFLTFNISSIVCRPLVRTNSNTSNPEGCQFSILTEQELLDFSHDPALRLVDTRIKEFYTQGEVCTGATLDGKLVAYDWCDCSATPHDRKHDIWVDFNADAGYGRKSFTLPAYRGKHIMPSLWAFSENYYLDKGKTLSISFVETDNYPSLRAGMRGGYPVVGYAGYIHLFGKLLSFRTAGAKKHGFRFYTPRSPAVAKS